MKDSFAFGKEVWVAGQTFALVNIWCEVFVVPFLEALKMVNELAVLYFYRSFKDYSPNNLPVSLD